MFILKLCLPFVNTQYVCMWYYALSCHITGSSISVVAGAIGGGAAVILAVGTALVIALILRLAAFFIVPNVIDDPSTWIGLGGRRRMMYIYMMLGTMPYLIHNIFNCMVWKQAMRQSFLLWHYRIPWGGALYWTLGKWLTPHLLLVSLVKQWFHLMRRVQVLSHLTTKYLHPMRVSHLTLKVRWSQMKAPV